MSTQLRTRFAPSPTGHLHLGHAAHLLFVWGVARAVGATIVLRMEDHDQTRCRPEYEQSILTDLHWLGLIPDGGYQTDREQYRQSSMPSRYTAALQQLQARKLLYGCNCTRTNVAKRNPTLAAIGGTPPYDGFCRDRGLLPAPPNGIRMRLPHTTLVFDDLLLGPQTQHPTLDLGDPRLVDRNGLFTYQLCVVADDIANGINLIIRGQDVLPSTGTQLQLAAALGQVAPPLYLHHPLVMDTNGQKLSKRYGSTALHALRAKGVPATDVLGQAAWHVGLQTEPTPLTPTGVTALLAEHPAVQRLRQAVGY